MQRDNFYSQVHLCSIQLRLRLRIVKKFPYKNTQVENIQIYKKINMQVHKYPQKIHNFRCFFAVFNPVLRQWISAPTLL